MNNTKFHLYWFFPSLGEKPAPKQAHGRKNPSHTKCGPGRHHVQGPVLPKKEMA